MAANWPIPAVMAGSRRTATRVTLGAISLSSSSHFPPMLYSKVGEAGGVAARPRQALDEAGADRIGDDARTRSARCGSPAAMAATVGAASGEDDVRRERDQFRRVSANARRHRSRPSGSRSARCGRSVQPNCCSPCTKRRDAGLHSGSSAATVMSTPMRRIALALLRARRERPRRRRAAEQRDELAPL